MVARLTPTANLHNVLRYNEKKVAQGKAELIHSKNFLQDTQRVTYEERLSRFQRLNELDTRSKVSTMHITLNFHPSEQLSNQQLIAIADRYMEGIGLGNQPYLVYRHEDAKHPHIHIVTSLITPNGRRIRTDKMGSRISEPIRKAIEKEFNLVPAGGKKQQGQTLATTDSIARTLEEVNRDYKFGSLAEYNAILRGHNVTVNASKKTGGLYYTALDLQGHKISPPLMASQLKGPYILAQLQKKFEQSKLDRKADLPSIRHRIEWALNQHPTSLAGLIEELRKDKIDLLVHRRADQSTYGLTYVDHQTKTAVKGGDLGKAYTADAILKGLPQELHRTPSKRPRNDKRPAAKDRPPNLTTGIEQRKTGPTLPHWNPNVPQSLSQLIQTDPAFGPSQDLDEEQKLRRRRRRHL